MKGEIPCQKVIETETVLAFHDVNKQAPVHILVIPKRHIADILELKQDSDKLIIEMVRTIQKIAQDTGLSDNGFRVVNNMGPEGGQTVDHIHFHLLGGRSMTWPPG